MKKFKPFHFFGGMLGGALIAFGILFYVLPWIDGLDEEASGRWNWSHDELVVARDDCYWAVVDQLDNGELDQTMAQYDIPPALGEEWVVAYCSSRAKTYQMFAPFEEYELNPITVWSRYAQTDFVKHDLYEACALIQASR